MRIHAGSHLNLNFLEKKTYFDLRYEFSSSKGKKVLFRIQNPDLDPDSTGSVDPDPGRERISQNGKSKERYFLKWWMFSLLIVGGFFCSLEILHGGQKIYCNFNI
jgi:hypothetical protein